MIVAGDFNAWNKKRMEAMDKLRKKLSLHIVMFTEEDKVKSFMGYPLDFVLYRGLEYIEKKVVLDHNISDHHPLLVRFRISD
jgi:endonuclease/exonuclease/phosphatase (EEP) superfamily protein YafD